MKIIRGMCADILEEKKKIGKSKKYPEKNTY